MQIKNEYMSALGRLGGRPRSPSISELLSQQAALRQKNDRRSSPPGGLPNSLRKLQELVKAEIKERGESVSSQPTGSPEGVV